MYGILPIGRWAAGLPLPLPLPPAALLPFPPFPATRPGAAPPAPAGYSILFPGPLPPGADALVQAAGGTVTGAIPAVGLLTAASPDPAFAARVLAGGGVAAAGPERVHGLLPPGPGPVELAAPAPATAADLYEAYQWDIRQVTGDGRSLDLGTGSHDVVVGIIGSGVDPGHPDLAGNLLGARACAPGTPGPADDHGPGTHMAGAVCGCGRILGVGPDLGCRAYRVCDATGAAATAWIIAAMLAAVADGVDVICLGVPGLEAAARHAGGRPRPGAADLLAYGRARRYCLEHQVAVVAAAGEQGAGPAPAAAAAGEHPGSAPAGLAGVISAGAAGPGGAPAAYVAGAPGTVDLLAPGGDWRRYPRAGWWADMCLGAFPGPRYAWLAGSALAAARAAGVVALAIWDHLRRTGRKPHPAQATALVLQAARAPAGAGPGAAGLADALAVLGGR